MCMKDQEIPWSEKKIKLQSVMGTMAWMVQRILFSDVEVWPAVPFRIREAGKYVRKYEYMGTRLEVCVSKHFQEVRNGEERTKEELRWWLHGFCFHFFWDECYHVCCNASPEEDCPSGWISLWCGSWNYRSPAHFSSSKSWGTCVLPDISCPRALAHAVPSFRNTCPLLTLKLRPPPLVLKALPNFQGKLGLDTPCLPSRHPFVILFCCSIPALRLDTCTFLSNWPQYLEPHFSYLWNGH